MSDTPVPPAIPLTTATTHQPRPFRARRFVHACAVAYAAVWIACALDPVSRSEWLLENLLPVSLLLFLAFSYRELQLSDVSYLALSGFLALHAVGAHYGYEAAPVPPMNAWLGLGGAGAGRNNFDRLVHLAFGSCVVYPLRELCLWRTRGGQRWSALLAMQAVVVLGALYEVFEWLAAALLAPEVGQAFVGAQGDGWDAQKDVAIAAMGAIAALLVVGVARRAVRARGRGGHRAPQPLPWLPAGERRRGERRIA